MRVLMLSTDKQILEIGSSAYMRMREYAELVDELHIVVLCGKKSGVEIHDDNMHLYPTNSDRKIRWISDAYRIAKRVIVNRKMNGVDSLISTQDPFELGAIGVRLKKKFGLKLQIQIHTDFTHKNFIRESVKNKVRNILAWRTLPYADGIRVVGKHIKRALIEKGFLEDKISVLPIFVDIEAIHNAEPIDLAKKYPGFSYYIVMISRLTHEKQVVWAANIVRKVRETHPEVCLVIVGEGPERQKLEKYEFVRVAGWIKDPIGHMKGADLFLNTSLYEGYGRTLLEAVAAKVPTLTTDVGIAREMVGESGVIVPIGDENALKEAIVGFVEGRSLVKMQDVEPLSKTAYLQAYLAGWSRCF